MKVTTPKFRVSYPNVFKAKENPLSKKLEYSVVALFPKGADLSALKKAAQEVIETKWGKDKAKWPKGLRSPFRDQTEKAKIDEVTGKTVLPAGHEEGGIFITLKSPTKPGLVDENVQDIIEETQFYAGCWARASVNAYAYDNMGNRGVSFGLNNIQKVGDGDPLGGRTRPQDDFEAVDMPSAQGTNGSADDLFG